MRNWKPWQYVFLVYLLLLNFVVFCVLSFFILNNYILIPPIPKSEPAVIAPPPEAASPTIVPTPTPFSQPIIEVEPTATMAGDTVEAAMVIPPVHIQPVPLPNQSASTGNNLATPTPLPDLGLPPDTPAAATMPETTAEVTPSRPPLVEEDTNTFTTPAATATDQVIALASVASTPTDTPIPTATNTATVEPTATPSPTNTATHTPSPTPSATNTATHTPSPTPSATNTATHTPSPTPSATNTATYTPSPTPSATNTATHTPTPQSTATNTATHTPSPTVTKTNTSTPPPSATPTHTKTSTPKPTATPTQASTATFTPSPSATASKTPTNSPTVTYTPSPSPTASRTSSPTVTPTRFSRTTRPAIALVTPRPTSGPAPTSTNTVTRPPSPTVTNTPWPTPTATHTPSRTATASPSPTRPRATSTNTVTPNPTQTSTPLPTRTPTATFTPSSTHTPLAKATPTLRATVTSSTTPLPSPTAIAVAANLTNPNPTDQNSGSSLARTTQPNPLTANTASTFNITPLTNGSLALSWIPVDYNSRYRIYSDMGSGYEVYVYKAETDQPAFIDEKLRPSTAYSYRVTQLSQQQEVAVAQVNSQTFARKLPDSDSAAAFEISAVSIVAAPTALPPDAVLLGLVSDNNFTDEFNTLTIVGEVRNDSNLNVGQTDITVTFYDAAGTVIGAATGETLLEVISPGEKSPFIINVTRPSGLASHSLRAIARPVLPEQSAQLAVTEVRRFEDDAGFFHIRGTIENVGSTIARRVKVAAVIYARDKQVINVGFTYSNPVNLSPGEQGSYDIIFAYYPRYLTQQVIPFEE